MSGKRAERIAQPPLGFWYLGMFVREWSSHPNFPKSFDASYYEAAYERLDDLAYWFFRGESPNMPGREWEPL